MHQEQRTCEEGSKSKILLVQYLSLRESSISKNDSTTCTCCDESNRESLNHFRQKVLSDGSFSWFCLLHVRNQSNVCSLFHIKIQQAHNREKKTTQIWEIKKTFDKNAIWRFSLQLSQSLNFIGVVNLRTVEWQAPYLVALPGAGSAQPRLPL